jgi:hypothetical protein
METPEVKGPTIGNVAQFVKVKVSEPDGPPGGVDALDGTRLRTQHGHDGAEGRRVAVGGTTLQFP